MLRATASLVAVVLACAVGAQDLSVPRSFHGFGDPSALALNAAETRAYVGESAAIAILDLTTLSVPLPASAVLARVGVDASVVGLTLDEPNQRLFIAGGSFGLSSMNLASPALPVTSHDDQGDRVCFEVALAATHVVAVFGARNASLLRVYDRTTLALVSSTPLGTGTAFAVAMDGVHAYVAMGSGGLTRVDLTNPAAPVVQPGPVFPVSVFGEPARARDIAVGGGRVYVAADGLGLVVARTTLPWGPAMPWSSFPLTGASGPATATIYGHRVGLVGAFVYVGATSKAGREHDGGPFTSYGPMNYSLAVGGVVTPSPLADSDAMVVFQLGAAGLVQVQQASMDGAWRELVAGVTKVYGVHAFGGTFVRSAANVGAVLASYHGLVNLPAEAFVSLRNPDVMLCGQDGSGPNYMGLLDITDPGAIAPIPGTATQGSFGLWFDAHWPDASPDREWFVGSGDDVWQLRRFDVTQPGLGHHWNVPSPDDPQPGFNNGRNYFLSWLDGDLLLLTRGGTRWGLVGHSKSALQAQAGALAPGSTLTTAPLWQLETHFAGELDQAQTWRCRTFALPSGQRYAAIAAGFHTAPGPDQSRPQVVLYDVTAGTAAAPTFVSRILGPNLQGNAMAVEPYRIGATTFLFVVDFGWGVHVYDVSAPAAPALVGGWQSPANAIDGTIDHPSDIEIDRDEATGNLYAYVTAWRRGLVRLDVTNPASFALPVVGERDTPGLPYGIARRDAYGSQGLVLADHQAGLRLYGQYASWQPFGSGCAGAAGVPAVQVTSPPVLGGTLSLAVQNLAGGIAVMVIGFTPVSVPLAPLGLGFGPGCTLLATPDVLEVLAQTSGTATWSLPIPNTASLRAVHLYQQVAEFAAPSAVSAGGDAKID
ncbi:MAG: hypothetical protein WAT39_12155 [Planctomycetota bacterium]